MRGRKPRIWVRLDCQGILHGSINYIYNLDEQAVFIKMIAMAEVYGPEPGLISDNERKALPREYIAHELHCPTEVLDSVIKKGISDRAIVENGSGIRLINFEHYQFTEYERQKPYRQKKKSTNKVAYLDNVFLASEEYAKLIEKFGENGTKDRIEALSLYIRSKGDKYKDHYATILNWERMNRGRDNGKSKSSPGKLIDRKNYTHPEDYGKR